MSYALEIQYSATLDMHEAFVWYEMRREGLGEEFIEEGEACFAKLAATPQHYSSLQPPFRRVIVKRFPYAVYFKIEGQTVFIIHVRYQGRKPLA